jgi:membrane associated rhomboid family serine protease
MKFPDEITSEMFERWLWRLAILLAVSPIFTAVCAILFFQDRIFIIASGAIGFVMGLTLMRASFGLKIRGEHSC